MGFRFNYREAASVERHHGDRFWNERVFRFSLNSSKQREKLLLCVCVYIYIIIYGALFLSVLSDPSSYVSLLSLSLTPPGNSLSFVVCERNRRETERDRREKEITPHHTIIWET